MRSTKIAALEALRAHPEGLRLEELYEIVKPSTRRTLSKALLRLRTGELADKVRESSGRRGASYRWFAVELRETAQRESVARSERARQQARQREQDRARERRRQGPFVPPRRVVEQSEPVAFFSAHRPGVYVIASGSCVARAYGESLA